MKIQIFLREIYTFQWRWAFCGARQLIVLPLSIQQGQPKRLFYQNLAKESYYMPPEGS